MSNKTSSVSSTLASSTCSTPSLSLARALNCSTENLRSMPTIELLITQLQCESSEARVDAMRRLNTVAEAIGTEYTLQHLLPFLASNIAMDDDEEDEILLTLADQLGRLVPRLIPGYRALPILPILERLAAVEETVVRGKAVESIQKIVPMLLTPSTSVRTGSKEEKKDLEGINTAASAAPALLLAMAKRLSGADWFTAKVSAAGILPVIYEFYSNNKVNAAKGANASNEMNSPEEAKRELRLLYKELSEDDTPMVKRSAAKNLGKFIESVAFINSSKKVLSASEATKNIIIRDLIPVFQNLANDEQDSVRLLAVVVAHSIGKSLHKDAQINAELVWPIVRNACSDVSWRVRHNLAKEFASVASSMGFTPPNGDPKRLDELFQCLSSLLQDTEAEVRAAAVTNIARMTKMGGATLFNTHIAPTLPALGDDPVMEVRSNLAQTLMDCCDAETRASILSDKIILTTIKPHIESFLNDEFAEVQLHILTKLSRISDLLNKMDVVVSSILQMSKDKNWRVREAVGRLLPHLAESMGISFFEEHLLQPWLKLLLDRVADVRSACVNGMPKLLSVGGAAWIQSDLLPQFTALYDDSPSYLTRITIIRCYSELCVPPNGNDSSGNGEIKGPSQDLHPLLLESIVTFMLKGLNDRVANVRMVSARGLQGIMEQCEKEVKKGRIEPALSERMKGDEDEDCKYFVQLALDACT